MTSWMTWLPVKPGPIDGVMLFAAVVVVGALTGEAIARLTRLPRVVGYTLAGWVAALGNFGVQLPLPQTARVVIDVSLALLLFEIGSRVRLRWLRHNVGLLATSVLESLVAGLAVYFALTALGIRPLMAGACAVLAIPASAALSGRVAHELGAEGQVTQRMTLLTALDTLYGVLALVVLRGWIETQQAPDVLPAATAVAVSFVGALALASALAWAVSQATRRFDLRQEGPALLVLGLVMLAVASARWLGVSTLLVPLLAGILLRNVSDRAWAWPRHFGTAGGLLVLLLFVLIGSSWSPGMLVAGGVAAVALLLARGGAKAVVVSLLSRPAHLSTRKGLALSLTLTPLSATALVMLGELHRADAPFAAEVAPIVLTALAIGELLGPVAALLALRAVREVAGPVSTIPAAASPAIAATQAPSAASNTASATIPSPKEGAS